MVTFIEDNNAALDVRLPSVFLSRFPLRLSAAPPPGSHACSGPHFYAYLCERKAECAAA
jgi:hypothetical protein